MQTSKSNKLTTIEKQDDTIIAILSTWNMGDKPIARVTTLPPDFLESCQLLDFGVHYITKITPPFFIMSFLFYDSKVILKPNRPIQKE